MNTINENMSILKAVRGLAHVAGMIADRDLNSTGKTWRGGLIAMWANVCDDDGEVADNQPGRVAVSIECSKDDGWACCLEWMRWLSNCLEGTGIKLERDGDGDGDGSVILCYTATLEGFDNI